MYKVDKIITQPRMRTLDECYNELKAIDPNTSVSKYFIRRLAVSGTIPCIMAGRKRLINFDKLLAYLSGDNQDQGTHSGSGINPVII